MNGGFIQSWLNEVDLKVFDDDTCKKTKSKKGFISGSMFCAGYLNGKYTIKRLLTFKSATIIEIGIISFVCLCSIKYACNKCLYVIRLTLNFCGII